MIVYNMNMTTYYYIVLDLIKVNIYGYSKINYLI